MTQLKNILLKQIGINPLIDLTGYSKLTRHRHMQSIREYLQISTDKKERRKIMKVAALYAATKKENLADIINCVIEELIKSKFELPAFQKLVRLARAARTVVNNDNYERIFNALSDEQKKLLDIIIGITADEILPGISPYWTEHLNRFGTFHLDMHKMMPEIEYALRTPDI